eukprot:TRINITY_DN183_c0_g1_i4.p1 TRINITY_DN183_c0_g1~~TRINITY_DN183_c0_g1_i4.p1  ORF type:complete len:934 (+),score=338.50 TRINITY_DN183_c0_g1_i4:316-2802(+)
MANARPTMDPCSDDWKIETFVRVNNEAVGTLRRSIKAPNSNEDRSFVPGPMNIVIAYGTPGQDKMAYHKKRKLITSMTFIKGEQLTTEDTSPFGLDNVPCPLAHDTPATGCKMTDYVTQGFKNNGHLCMLVLDQKSTLYYQRSGDVMWLELVVKQAPGGWAALGVPEEPGEMEGSRVVVQNQKYYNVGGMTSESISQVEQLGSPFKIDSSHQVYGAEANGDVVVSFAVTTEDDLDLVVAYRAVGGFPEAVHDVHLAVRVGDEVSPSPAHTSAPVNNNVSVPTCVTWSVSDTDDYRICPEVDGDDMLLHFKVNTTGWVGFGISKQPDGEKIGSDMAIVQWDNGVPFVADAYAMANARPTLDFCSYDWKIVTFERTNSAVVGTLRRSIKAPNSNEDRSFVPGPMNIVIAYGTPGQDKMAYHNNRKLITSMTFIKGEQLTTEDTSPFGLDNVPCPGNTLAPDTPAPKTTVPTGCKTTDYVTQGFKNNGHVCMLVLDQKSTLYYQRSGDVMWLELVVKQAPGGWAALGVPEEPGEMEGSRVVVQNQKYYNVGGMTSESISQVEQLGSPFKIDSSHQVYGAEANGDVVVSFAVTTEDDLDLVVAYRAVGGFPEAVHDVRLAVRVGDGATVSVPSDNTAKAKLHGWVMMVVWSYVVPCAIVVKALGLSLGMVGGYPVAFLLHGFLLFTSVVVTTVFVGLALVEFKGVTTHAHKALGITVMCVAWAQVFLGLMAPPKEHYARLAFRLAHITLGLGIVGMAVAQQLTGLYNMKVLHSESTAEYQLMFMFIGFTICFLAAVVIGNHHRNPPEKFAELEPNEPVNGGAGMQEPSVHVV